MRGILSKKKGGGNAGSGVSSKELERRQRAYAFREHAPESMPRREVHAMRGMLRDTREQRARDTRQHAFRKHVSHVPLCEACSLVSRAHMHECCFLGTCRGML